METSKLGTIAAQAVETDLQWAEVMAKRGKTSLVQMNIDAAIADASEAEIEVDETRIAEIKQTCRQAAAASLSLSLAEIAALQGDENRMGWQIWYARLMAARADAPVNEARIERMEQLGYADAGDGVTLARN